MSEYYSHSGFVDAARRWPVLTAAAPRPKLVQVALDRPVCVVGTGDNANLTLSAAQISKAHALIVQDGGGVYLRDLASRNGTFVNDSPVRDAWLKSRDLVRFAGEGFFCHSGFERPSTPLLAPPAELWMSGNNSPTARIFHLERQSFVIGRRATCDLVLPLPEIALAHAAIFSRDGRRYLRDFAGEHTTLVNGNPIREIELRDDDQIQIGPTRLQFHGLDMQLTLVDEPDLTDVASRPRPGHRPPSVDEEVADISPRRLARQLPTSKDVSGHVKGWDKSSGL